jgi:methylmalonyl-CoA carboxyltransferase large subunit
MVKTKDLAEILEKVQAQLTALSERIEQLEAAAQKQSPPAVAPATIPVVQELSSLPAKPEITNEEIIAISAALGAYLGVRVRIRRIRLLGSRAWAQQGRVSMQASHNVHN